MHYYKEYPASFSKEIGCLTNSVSQNYEQLGTTALRRRIRALEEHNMKFKQIGHTTRQYGQSFSPETISAWNGLAFVEDPSLAVFR